MNVRKKISVWISCVLMVLTLSTAGCTKNANQNSTKPADTESAPEITLQAVSFLPKNDPQVAVIPMWIERVEKATGNKVKINWKGGPDVIPAMEQIEALRNGVVDVNFNVAAYYEALAPETRAFSLSEHTPWEERENGFYEYMVERHSKIGTVYLGRWLGELPFYLWVNKSVTKPEDLKGRSLRTRSLYDRFMKELGIVPVSVDYGEVYSALERGIVQGFGLTLIGPRASGWTEVTKYVIDHPFYNQNGTILINPKSWAKLSSEQQKAIIAATAEFEHDMMDYFKKATVAERAELEKQGVQFNKFSPEDASRYVKTAYDVEWSNLKTKLPDQYDQLEKISRKK